MKHLIDIFDLSVEQIDALLKTACDIRENPAKYAEKCKGKKIATLFFEPSTRTRLSFEAAMLELGGSVIGFSDGGNSSASKGESVADTTKVVSCYADIIAMRHFKEGAPFAAALSASIPVINAGDGGHAHPTQTLADLLTIFSEKGRLGQLKIGFCGDLKYGRTVHSLIAALSRYEDIEIVLISPKELALPDYVKDEFMGNMKYSETTDLENSMADLDVLYMTRVQKERFDDLATYERLKDVYILDTAKLQKAKADMSILHPLPRVNEISVAVDEDERACYFKQVMNGKLMRMALILHLLSLADGQKLCVESDIEGLVCTNERCVTVTEQEARQLFKKVGDGIYRCRYCEAEKNIQKK